jgi:hypothetical protein
VKDDYDNDYARHYIIGLLPNSPPPSLVSKLSLFLGLPVAPFERTDGGSGEEPNHTPVREPGPPQVSQYSLRTDNPL